MNHIDLSRTDLNLLVLFEAVMAEGNVARAASRLCISPSAVSHGLGRLRRLLNDPLFIRTPKGVAPTARAMELGDPIADILGQVRGVVSSAEVFDPRRSTRRFTIGAPDGVSAVVMPELLARLQTDAPLIGLCEQTIRPEDAFLLLDTHTIDLVIGPAIGEAPARFRQSVLFDEDFVICMRADLPLAGEMTLDRYCAAAHLLVSSTGDASGLVDRALAAVGRSRRIAYVAPNFMLALAILSDTSLIAALPRRLAERHCDRFSLVFVEPPLKLQTYAIVRMLPTAALADAGVQWLFDAVGACQLGGTST
ncbi:LysR family transcriptional regulator [Brevundimonas kwangchunensis]|uniref:LysR family transcriptional regulator n=1 Tax=Brevundimonas kwangchunensis TaxID=322163 RepID=A0ABP3SA26_9CAUL